MSEPRDGRDPHSPASSAPAAPEPRLGAPQRERSLEQAHELHPLEPTLMPAGRAPDRRVGVVPGEVIDAAELLAAHPAART